jgi:hypothetical protein
VNGTAEEFRIGLGGEASGFGMGVGGGAVASGELGGAGDGARLTLEAALFLGGDAHLRLWRRTVFRGCVGGGGVRDCQCWWCTWGRGAVTGVRDSTLGDMAVDGGTLVSATGAEVRRRLVWREVVGRSLAV